MFSTIITIRRPTSSVVVINKESQSYKIFIHNIVILRQAGLVMCMILALEKEPMAFKIIKMLDSAQGDTDVHTQLHLIVNI